MSRPALYVAITNHGFGHATRAASVVAEVQRRLPDLLPVLVTTAPRWLLEAYMEGDFIHRPRAFDVGIVQVDSLTMDKTSTLEQLKQIRANQATIVAGEVNFIQQNRIGLMLADIPPLATQIARAANIPCWMMSNFGWDFIYAPWGGEFVDMANWIQDCFRQCDRLFRLPFHESMSAFRQITDVGLTGGTPRHSPEEMWARLGMADRPLPPKEKTVLLTFGGLGLAQIPYHNLQRFPDWQFLTFDQQAPDLPNLIKNNDRHHRPVDLMPLCGQLLSKPGYSTYAEACQLGLPIVSLTRDDFAEADLLLTGLQNHNPHRIISPEEFTEGHWDFLAQTVNPPKTDVVLAKNGNEVIAQAIVDYFCAC